MRAIAVAALSARLLAQTGVEAGLEVIALDVFGDVDTRSAAAAWWPIGAPDSMRIDGAALLDALASLARRGNVQGWIAGAGFEGRPELLELGAAQLPLLGTSGDDVRRVRDPSAFFACLDSLRIAHPAVRHDGVAGTEGGAGWLIKDFGGCGATHIRHADRMRRAPVTPLQYWQRQAPGTPMSATFIADGRRAVLLGCNEQIVRAGGDLGDRPYRFHGVLGPVPLPVSVHREVVRILSVLTEAFALRGLGSLDFMLDGGAVSVLEVNPRPPASLALYPRIGGVAVLSAHLNACRGGLPDSEAPQVGPSLSTPQARQAVRGTEIVFAERRFHLNGAAAAALAALPRTHDLPRCVEHEPHFAAGDPLCSVSACGADVASVRFELAQRRAAVLQILETLR